MWPVKGLLYFRHSLPSFNPDLSFIMRRINGIAGKNEILGRRLQSPVTGVTMFCLDAGEEECCLGLEEMFWSLVSQ